MAVATRFTRGGRLVHQHPVEGHPTIWHPVLQFHLHQTTAHSVHGAAEPIWQLGRGHWGYSRAPSPEQEAIFQAALSFAASTAERYGYAGAVRLGEALIGASIERKFGVEIEFFGATAHDLQEAMRAKGLVCYAESYNHTRRSYWKIITDSSVTSRGTGVGQGLELVSPPMRGDDGFEQLRRATEALAEIGAKVDRSCGLHVHLDAADLTVDAARALVRSYYEAQKVIDQVLPKSRRSTSDPTYSHPLDEYLVERLLRASTLQEMARLNDRYFVVNVAAFAKHGTIEFRQHSGSIEYEKISAWVRFCLAAFENAKTATWGDGDISIRPLATGKLGATVSEMVAALALREEDVTYWARRERKYHREFARVI